MANKKFSEFVDGGALQNNDTVVGLRSGINTKFTSTPNVSIANTVFVAPNGSNVTGNGSLSKPYATVAFAMASITTATSVNPFNIVIFGGRIVETTAILLKPNIGIMGMDQQVTVVQSAPMTLDATYLSATTSSTAIAGLTINGPMDFDFSAASTVAGHVISITGASVGSVSINGNAQVLPTLSIDAVGMGNLTVNNAILLLYATTLSALTGGNLSSTKPTTVISIGNSFSGNLNLGAQLVGFTCSYFFRGNFINPSVTVTVTNPLATWHPDPSSYKAPVIVNTGNVVLDSVSDGLDGNYTPTNYTPVATPPTLVTSLRAHLEGINNALGGIVGETNVLYVSPNGSDATGNGSFGNPYATVSHAMTTIVTAAVNNQFLINVIEGAITETAQIVLKPFVNLSSATEDINIAMTSNLIVHSSWGTVVNGTSFFENLRFSGGNLVFDFSAFGNVVLNSISLDGIACPNITGNSNVNSLFNLQVRDSTAASVTLDNLICSFHSATINAMTCGSLARVKNSVMNFMACLLGSGALNFTGDNAGAITNRYFMRGCKNTGTVTVTNVNSFLDMDTSSYVVPTVVNNGTIVLSSLSNSLNANYTPVNYTPIATPPDLVNSTHAHLRGIDAALINTQQDLQQTYDTGANATVTLSSGRPILFKNADSSLSYSFEKDQYVVLGLSPSEELFSGPPLGSTSNAADRIEGYTFTPSANFFATQFQYRSTAISAGARDIGLWEFGNTTALATGNLVYTDNIGEDGVWRYTKIDPPVLLHSGTRYVVAAVIPASEPFYFGVPTGLHANISINSGADGPNTSTLTYPSVFAGTGVNGNASIGISPATPTTVLDIDYTGITNIYAYKSQIYPAIISFPGFSLAVLNYAFYTRVGQIGQITAQITVTASSTTGTITLDVPDTVLFPDTFQCVGVGTIINPSTPTTAAAGIILAIFSVSGTPFVRMNIAVPASATNYIIYVDFKYQIQ